MPRWTDESRAKQSEAIHQWAPWNHSTGPVTGKGKAIVSRNAHRFTIRKSLKIANFLYKQKNHLLAGRPFASQQMCELMLADNYIFLE